MRQVVLLSSAAQWIRLLKPQLTAVDARQLLYMTVIYLLLQCFIGAQVNK